MAVTLPNGSKLRMASQYGASIVVSAISNGSPALASVAAHGLEAGDLIELTSGWSQLNGRVVRVGEVPDVGSFELEGIDTTDVVEFEPGDGVGSVRKVTGWVPVPQVLEFATSGGEAQFTGYSFLESDDDGQVPNGKSAMSLQIKLADDPALPCYPVLRAADGGRKVVALELKMRNNSRVYYNGFVSFSDTPEVTKGNVMAVKAGWSLTSKPMRYSN